MGENNITRVMIVVMTIIIMMKSKIVAKNNDVQVKAKNVPTLSVLSPNINHDSSSPHFIIYDRECYARYERICKRIPRRVRNRCLAASISLCLKAQEHGLSIQHLVYDCTLHCVNKIALGIYINILFFLDDVAQLFM